MDIWDRFCNYFYKNEIYLVKFIKRKSQYFESKDAVYFTTLVFKLSAVASYEWEREFNREFTEPFTMISFDNIKIKNVYLHLNNLKIDIERLQDFTDQLKIVIAKTNEEVRKNTPLKNAKRVKDVTKNLKI